MASEYVCKVCGKDCGSKRSLGQHRRYCKGAAGDASSAPGRPAVLKKRGLPRKARAAEQPPEEPGSVSSLFERLAEAINARSALDGEIVAGMKRVVAAVKGLRKVTLQTRKDLLDLRKDVAAVDVGLVDDEEL